MIRRPFYSILHTLQVLIKSKYFWSWSQWFKFWVGTNSQEIQLDGHSFIVRSSFFSKLTDMYVLLENIYDKEYEFNIGKNENIKIIDIGAHIGGFCIAAAKKFSNSEIYAFEPFPDNFRLLRGNIDLNGFTNIISSKKAVAGKMGPRKIYKNPINTSAHSLSKSSSESIDIECTTLDELFLDNEIDTCHLLKMDCEGGEYEIFLNTSMETLKKIKEIIMEYHVPKFFGLNDDNLLKKLVEKLQASGFKVSLKSENYERGYIRAVRHD